ncbi:MAG: DUF3575 domain-containing protein [Rikenellaceae bacterium]
MRRIITLLTLFLCLQTSYGQTTGSVGLKTVIRRDSTVSVTASPHSIDTILRTNFQDRVSIYYRFDKDEIDSTYLTNAEALKFIDLQLCDSTALAHLDSLSLNAVSSPEGPRIYNEKLSKRRAESLYNYLISKYPESKTKIMIGYSGEDWDSLRKMVVESTQIPNKEDVLAIIDSDVNLDTKEYRLKNLDSGSSWHYIIHNMLCYLRYGASAIFYYDIEYIKGLEPEPEPEPIPEPEPEPTTEPEPEPEIKPLFALKTNLLYDAVTALNVELEVPISNRWSIAGEWVFPWWSSSDKESSKRNCFQLLNGNIEGKYWFGDRTKRPVMTGWHLGLYAGGGLYDLERNKEGYQGEFFIAAGLSGGYAHTIFEDKISNGNLRMEYSVAVGYLQTDYDKYTEHWGIDNSWHTIRQESGNYTWIGPTRAKVSLVWMFNRKVNKEK